MAEEKNTDNTREEKTPEEKAAEARDELARIMAEPLDSDEAARIIAENDVHRSQLKAYRLSVEAKIAGLQSHLVEIDTQLNAIDGEDALARRRVLNVAEAE